MAPSAGFEVEPNGVARMRRRIEYGFGHESSRNHMVGWAMALLFLTPHARGWYRTYAFFGRIDGHMVRQMLCLCRFTGQMRILGLSIAALLSLLSISASWSG